ncbi:MAG: glycine dehydrogenase (aminomethyl-transferring) [Candidatus Margulisbacteria bacterium GWF2_35_9]|nr:MAG: glycine dehydrogenase (aminomethyl-transferring) [Candidatus Margulisbacteria bacterium GWF2_35_9]
MKNRPIFYKKKEELKNVKLSALSVGIPENLIRKKPLRFPTLAENEVARHYTYLSTLNHGVDSGFYPLGSCTMKYNFKILEKIAGNESFSNIYPFSSEEDIQGLLEILYRTDKSLSEIFGYAHFTFQPAAGSHGEHTGLLIIRAFHKDNGESDRDVVLIPDTAHGTNPASAVLAGYKVRKIPTNDQGNLDLEFLKKEVSNYKVAALMLTNPSTLGLFETQILEIAEIVHDAGGLLYYDGANANALMGIIRPGDMGFDVCHLNLHKTFGTPHGGGGPGSGPVGVKDFLVPFLPNPLVKMDDGMYVLDSSSKKSIGKVHGFYGNINVVIKAFVFIIMYGRDGLKHVSQQAIINANYLQEKLKDVYKLAYNRRCMHEFVLSAAKLKKDFGISALDIAKRLIDYGIHPPTIYFPQIVSESMMMEPTESESKEELDDFIQIMTDIRAEIETNPEILHDAPITRVVGRLDEAKAVKEPKLTALD